VNQRSALQDKGDLENNMGPHVLVMSATPIPRSLALILYGDLDISVIDELPSGRQPVKTRLVPENKRESMYAFIKTEAQRGHQAYIV
jgi:ATP-dependent DNA helicase RecG